MYTILCPHMCKYICIHTATCVFTYYRIHGNFRGATFFTVFTDSLVICESLICELLWYSGQRRDYNGRIFDVVKHDYNRTKDKGSNTFCVRYIVQFMSILNFDELSIRSYCIHIKSSMSVIPNLEKVKFRIWKRSFCLQPLRWFVKNYSGYQNQENELIYTV